MKTFAEIAFTPAVQALQERHGSRAAYARQQQDRDPGEGLGANEIAFLAEADSFYLATVGETGWPYVQHRGGPKGFLRPVAPARLAFADFRGNRQYVSAGNAAVDDRASIFVMDYARRARLKLLGRLHFADIASADPLLVDAVVMAGYPGRPERIATFEIEAFDWNCSQHVTRRFTLAEIEGLTRTLQARIAELEAELAGLRAAATERA